VSVIFEKFYNQLVLAELPTYEIGINNEGITAFGNGAKRLKKQVYLDFSIFTGS
jgi:hypothetical protein